MRSEKEIEDAYVAWVERNEGKAYKLIEDGRRGFPDRTVLFPGCRAIFVEFKKPGGTLSKNQLDRLLELYHAGQHIAACDSLEEALFITQTLLPDYEFPSPPLSEPSD